MSRGGALTSRLREAKDRVREFKDRLREYKVPAPTAKPGAPGEEVGSAVSDVHSDPLSGDADANGDEVDGPEDEQYEPSQLLIGDSEKSGSLTDLPGTTPKSGAPRIGPPANTTKSRTLRIGPPAITLAPRSTVRGDTVIAADETAEKVPGITVPSGVDNPVGSVPAAISVLSNVPPPTRVLDVKEAVPVQVPRPRIVTGLMAALGFNPSATNAPVAPVESPALWALLAWARREFDRTFAPLANINPFGGAPAATSLTVDSPAVATLSAAVPAAAVVAPTTTQIGWVTGPQSPTNDTINRFGIWGTDIGTMWANPADPNNLADDEVLMAFGDTFSGPGMTGAWRSNVLLSSIDTDLTDANGLYIENLPVGNFAPQFIHSPPFSLGLFGSEVTAIPTAGIAVYDPVADNTVQYVNYMSVRSWDTPGRWTTNYSAIAYSDDDGLTWQVDPSTIRSAGWLRSTSPYTPGNQNFQMGAFVVQPDDKLVQGEPRFVYNFGTPSGRAGSAHVSRVPEQDVLDLSKYEYWDGSDWVANNPSAAVKVFGDSTSSPGLFGWFVDLANDPNFLGGYLGGLVGPKTGGNVSEMSVQYNEYLDKYVVLYSDANNNVVMRTADDPQGPWSEKTPLVTSGDYPGLYAPMIHPWSGTDKLTPSNPNDDNNYLYWNLSLWSPYNVTLMQTDLSPMKTTMV